jgi:uncharacterized protein VirK/YbjX
MNSSELQKLHKDKIKELLRREPQIQKALEQFLEAELLQAREAAAVIDDMVQLRRMQGEAQCLKRLLKTLSADAKAAP